MNRNVLLILIIVLILCILKTSESFSVLSDTWSGTKKVGSKAKKGVKFVTLDAPQAVGGFATRAPGRFFNKMEDVGTDKIVPKLDRTRIRISNTIDSGAVTVGSAYGKAKTSLGGTYGGVKTNISQGVKGVVEDKYENPIIGGGKLLLSPIDRTIRGGAVVGDTILTTSGGFATDLTKSVLTTPLKATSYVVENIINPGYGFIADVSDATIVPAGRLVGGTYDTVYGLGDKYIDDKILVPAFDRVDSGVTYVTKEGDKMIGKAIKNTKKIGRDAKAGAKRKLNSFFDLFDGDDSDDEEEEDDIVGGGGSGGGGGGGDNF